MYSEAEERWEAHLTLYDAESISIPANTCNCKQLMGAGHHIHSWSIN